MTLTDGFTGGSLIGASAAMLLLFSGEVMGASGIVNSVILHPQKALTDPSQHWKLVFMASFLLLSHLYVVPHMENIDQIMAQQSSLSYLLAGLFVGFGASLGSGCTSGHGICGLGRFSPRSLSAILTFMGSAILTTYLTKNEKIWQGQEGDHIMQWLKSSETNLEKTSAVFIGSVALSALIAPFLHSKKSDEHGKVIPGLVTGMLFAYGLYVSGMANPGNVRNFLDVGGMANGTWDPSLMAVMGAGVLVSFVSYQFIEQHAVTSVVPRRLSLKGPIAMRRGSSFENIPNKTNIDNPLLVGAASFGVGWALSGICPAPALVLAAGGVPQALLLWWPAYYVGSFVGNEVKRSASS